MDNAIVEVAIGLVLTYTCLALLVMKLQESFNGALMRGRTSVLHDLVYEAVGQDNDLREAVFKNPLIFALSTGTAASPRLMRPNGPSAIPPALFARVLLMELNGGAHPSEKYATPAHFMAAASSSAIQADAIVPPPSTSKTRREELLRGLGGLMANREGDWEAFEAAIASWFSDIGDRSKGWYKRRSDLWGWCIAVAVCAGLNIDSLHIARVLGDDNEFRVGLSQLAGRLTQEQERDSAAATATVPAAREALRSPQVLAKERLADASESLSLAYEADNEVAAFGRDLLATKTYCAVIWASEKTSSDEKNNPKRRSDQSSQAKVNFGKFISNSDTWMTVLPALQPLIDRASNGLPLRAHSLKPDTEDAYDPVKTLQDVHLCMSHVAAWVHAAGSASHNPDVRRQMQQASQALDDSQAAVLSLLQMTDSSRSLKTMFKRDPETFHECLKSAGGSRAELNNCLRKEVSLFDRLPVGHTTSNWRQQFCKVEIGVAREDHGVLGLGLCDARPVEASAALGISAMSLSTVPWSCAQWMVGILVSALFVSLGAPFWFGLLSKLVRIRAAGDMSDTRDPLPSSPASTPSKPSGSPSALRAVESAPVPSVQLASNRFEDQLTVREVMALQQRLGVTASGKLDGPTRLKLKTYCVEHGLGADDTLTLAIYTAVVGRPPRTANAMMEMAGARPTLGKPHPLVQSLSINLMAQLNVPPTFIPPTERTFSNDLRALAVLYRYKRDPVAVLRDRAVFNLAIKAPAQLDELDDVLMNEILSLRSTTPTMTRASKPWMDWALAELGQVENNASQRAASNPRICEYLDAASPRLGDQGDKTPWCGAFVAWVLQRHNAIDQPAAPQRVPATPETASSWTGWATHPASGPQPQFGDVIVVRTTQSASGFHVGFCLEADATSVWLLGGNQAGGTRVSLSKWPLSTVQ